MTMLAPAHMAAYTNPPPMLATQHPQALMQDIYEMYGTVPANPGFNYTGIDSRLVHELTLQQVVGQRVMTQETQIVRRQLSTQLLGIRVLAPIRQVNALKIRFPYMEWNPALIGLVPERGRTRGTSFTQRVIEKQLDRYAGGDHFGLEMLTSEIGPTVLAESRNTNLDATMMTLEFQVWVEARRSYDVAWEMEKQMMEQNVTAHSMSIIESRAKTHWALFQLNQRALYHLNTKTQEYQAKYQGKGNAWFIHMKSERYLAQVPDERIQYFQAGPGGPNLLESLPGQGIRVIGDKPVFVMQNMDVYGLGAMEVLENQAEYLEYYNMADMFKDTDYEDYTSESRTIQLLDADRGCWERFTLMQALDASGRYDEMGEPVDVLALQASAATRDAFAAPVDQFDSCYYIGEDSRQHLVRFMGQIEQRAVSARTVLVLAQSVVRKLGGLSVTPQQAMVHMNVLAKAVNDCHEFDPNSDDVQAYVKAMIQGLGTTTIKGYTEWARNGSFGSFRLPRRDGGAAFFDVVPFGGNYAMFKAVAEALRSEPTAERFTTAYGLNHERAKQIQVALDVFDELARSLDRLLPGSVLLRKDYASPWFHNATAQHTLFENTLGQSRLPLFLRPTNARSPAQALDVQRQGAASDAVRADAQARTAAERVAAARAAAAAQPPTATADDVAAAERDAAAATARADAARARLDALHGQEAAARGIPVEEARSQALGLSSTYAGDLMARFTGRLAVRSQLAGRPTFVRANIAGGATGGDTVVFDTAPAVGANKYADAGKLKDAQPKFAKALFAFENTEVQVTANTPELAAGASEAQRAQYLNLVKLLFNYRAAANVTDVDKILLAERNRAIALLIASAVNDAGTAEDVSNRFKALFTHLLTPANGVVLKDNAPLSAAEIQPIFGAAAADSATVQTAIRNKISSFLKANNTDALVIFDNTGGQRIVSMLPSILHAAQDLKQAFEAKPTTTTTTTTPSMDALYEESEYLRSPLTFGPSQFRQMADQVRSLGAGGTELPFMLPADPIQPAQPISVAMFEHYVRLMDDYSANTPPALFDEKTVKRAAAALRMYNHMNAMVAKTRDHDTYQAHRAHYVNIKDLQVDQYGNVLNWSSLTPVLEARAQAAAERVDVYSGRTYAELANDDSQAMAVDYGSLSLFRTMGRKEAEKSAYGGGAATGDVLAQASEIVGMVSASFAANWASVSDNAADSLTEIVAKVYLCQKHHRRVFEAAYKNNTLFPKRFLLWRRARFTTLSALFAQVGGEAMETFITFPRFYYGSDPSTQEYEYNFHFWAGTVVKRPELLYWADHVQIIRYLGGWGMVPLRPSDVTDDLASVRDTTRSIYVYEEPYEPIMYEEEMPITGRRGDYSPKVASNVTANSSLLFGNAFAANLLYKWLELNQRMHEDESASVPQERPWLNAVQNIMPIAHRGTARFYGTKRAWLHQSKGWFPSDIVSPRMLEVFNGALESFHREDLSNFVPLAA